jgi:DNA-binding LacI/PurR family transcriptional regulator
MAVTLKDIATKVGVSIATVSRVLNGREAGGIVSPETRQRIFATALELGYKPNLLARGLRASRSSLIGVLVRDVADPFMRETLKGINEVTVKRGYRLFLGNVEQAQNAIGYGTMFERSHADGILILGDVKEHEQAVEHLASKHRYVVGVVDRVTRRQYPGVYTDDSIGTRLALDHLWSLGHRRIVCVAERGGCDRRLRAQTYIEWMREHDLDEHIQVLRTTQSPHAAYEVGLSLLAAPDYPTAICALSDRIALGLLQAAFRSKIVVPDQVSMVGYGNLEYAQFLTPPLTTINQSPFEMGCCAAELLLNMIEQRVESANVDDAVLQPELMIRQSTAIPRHGTKLF